MTVVDEDAVADSYSECLWEAELVRLLLEGGGGGNSWLYPSETVRLRKPTFEENIVGQERKERTT